MPAPHRYRTGRVAARTLAVVSVASFLGAAALTTVAQAQDPAPGDPPAEAGPAEADFDGDGLLDLAMAGFTDRDTEAGVVVVDYAGDLADAHLLPAGTDTTTGFGVGLASGDIDYDGYDDLVVGCSACGWSAGQEYPVSLFRGSPDGLFLDETVELGGEAGAAVAVGFLNQGTDGIDAIASAKAGDGATVTTFESDQWESTKHLVDPPIGTADHTPSVTIAEVTGDDYVDLILGTPTTDGGSVTVFEGPVENTPVDQRTYQAHEFGADLARFGEAVEVTDVNGDRTGDILVGAPSAAEVAGGVTCGALVVIPSLGEPHRIGQETEGVPGRCEAGDLFGHDLVTADVDNDGDREIVVGVPGEDIGDISNAGSYTVLDCDLAAADCTGSLGVTQNTANVPGSPEAGDRFGFAVAGVDADHAGGEDLLVGAPGESIGDVAHAGGVLVAVSDAAGAPGPASHDVGGDDYGVSDLGWSLG